MDRRTERTVVRHVSNSSAGREPHRRTDHLVVEEPLTIRLDGAPVATTMRTPGDDFELAVGLCFTDGLLAGAPVTAVRYCSDTSQLLQIGRRADPSPSGNVVAVETGGRAPRPSPRLGNVSSSCGWCGSDQLDAMCARLDPLPPGDPFDLDVIHAVPDAVAARQPLFAETGSVHAAAAFDRDGRVLVVREDVGRHNAVDKVVGSFVLDDAPTGAEGRPATGLGLFVSGRASIEMVQKAWAAGFGALVAVSAPTALAVRAAQLANLTLVGFARPDGFNLYAPELP